MSSTLEPRMTTLKQLSLFIFLFAFLSPAFAAVDGITMTSCSVYSDTDDKKGDKKESEEEEPDCE